MMKIEKRIYEMNTFYYTERKSRELQFAVYKKIML